MGTAFIVLILIFGIPFFAVYFFRKDSSVKESFLKENKDLLESFQYYQANPSIEDIAWVPWKAFFAEDCYFSRQEDHIKDEIYGKPVEYLEFTLKREVEDSERVQRTQTEFSGAVYRINGLGASEDHFRIWHDDYGTFSWPGIILLITPLTTLLYLILAMGITTKLGFGKQGAIWGLYSCIIAAPIIVYFFYRFKRDHEAKRHRQSKLFKEYSKGVQQFQANYKIEYGSDKKAAVKFLAAMADYDQRLKGGCPQFKALMDRGDLYLFFEWGHSFFEKSPSSKNNLGESNARKTLKSEIVAIKSLFKLIIDKCQD